MNRGWKENYMMTKKGKGKREKKKTKKKNQMIEHLENSPHGNVTNAFLFLFYSSLSLPYVESPRVMMRVPKVETKKTPKIFFF